ncbi:MAG TPA: tellurite resistance/C4-dicarboxylate transporter family protein [Streptosporangiaceae bacterium]|nr:tellurite resistance/C4-dicarboxylate transporter family protein [Streptosporangiaceae bacterium]
MPSPEGESGDNDLATAQRPLTADSPPPLPGGLIGRFVATFDPGYFAFVMASGIVSVGTGLLGHPVISDVTLAVTAAGFVALGPAYLARAVCYAGWFRRSLRNPVTAMAYFTLVAGTDVLALRLAMAGYSRIALGLGAAGALLWLVLTYALPWSVVAAARRPVLAEFNGTWLIWVVATQSVAVLAAGVAPSAPWPALRQALPEVAVTFWGIGVMLYVILIVIIFLRLMLIEVTPAEMGPAYWIAMGATAISVRAAAGILALRTPGSAPLLAGLRPFLVGLSVVLWAFGSWWIPLLVLFGYWRHVRRRYPLAYEPRLWSMVFPVGMYAVASATLGKTPGLAFMLTIARGWVWAGVAAWASVLALMATAGAQAARAHRRHRGSSLDRRRGHRG